MKKLVRGRIYIQSYLLKLMFFLFLTNPVSAQNYHEKYELESSYFGLTLNSKGKINTVFDKKRRKSIPLNGETAFKDCSEEVLSVEKENETIVLKKKVVGENGQTLFATEIFSFENDLLKWELIINPEGNETWSTPVQTIWSMPAKGVKYWTTWGDPRPEEGSLLRSSEKDLKNLLDGAIQTTNRNLSVLDWADPLVPQPLYPRRLTYGATILGDPKIDDHFVSNIHFGPTVCRNYISVPVVGLFNERRNLGVSLGFSPENIGLEACLDVTKEGDLIFSRYNNRFTPGKELHFTTFIKLHQASWRSSLSWYVEKFARWFNPVNPSVNNFSGTSSYSSEKDDFDVQKMKDMAYKTNWDATFPFIYMGMFLPPVKDDEGWLSWRGEYVTFKKLDNYYKKMQDMGFNVLSYFNVTEFGSNILRQEYYQKRHEERTQWIDCNQYLMEVLEPAILYNPMNKNEQEYIYSWNNSIVVDPGEPVYERHLIDQIKRHIDKLPHLEGITIDRLDWTRLYNTRCDDGISWFRDKPARSLHVSWKSIMNKIGPLLHENEKVLFINNHVKRLDDLKQVDGIFDEYGYVPASLNANAFLCVNKPLLGWCLNKESIGKDYDAYMQKFLYLGMFPMAPFPGNDHGIRPDEELDKLYLEYGKLFKVMKGKQWLLEPEVVQLVGNNAKMNVFKTDNGIIIPITFGQEDMVRLKLSTISKQDKIQFIHPGEETWQTVKLRKNEVIIPLKRGCAMVQINLKEASR